MMNRHKHYVRGVRIGPFNFPFKSPFRREIQDLRLIYLDSF